MRRDRRNAQLPPAWRRAQAQLRATRREGRHRRNGVHRTDHRQPRGHHRADDRRRTAAAGCDGPDRQSGDDGGGAGQGHGLLHLHIGHHRHAQGQRDDALPVAASAGRVWRPRRTADQQRHHVLLPAAVPQQRAHRRVVLGAELGCGAGVGQVVLGVEVLGRGDPLQRHRIRLHRRDLRLSAQPATQAHRPTAQGAGDRRQRPAAGDLG